MCGRRCLDLGILPLSVGFTMFAAMFICYTIAILEGHMDPILPAISDTGIYKPEKFIFAQLINIACALAVVTFLLRYKMVHLRTHNDPDGHALCCIGLVCCVLGILGGLGLTVVANFPDDQAKAVHFTGAGFVFGMGSLYQCLDSFLSFKMYPTHNGKTIAIVRSCLAAVSVIGLVTTVTSSILFTSVFGGDALTKDMVLHWKEGQNGHTVHLVSTFSEWIMAFSFNLYFFTYIGEFQHFTSTLDVQFYLCSRDRDNVESRDGSKNSEQVRTHDLWPQSSQGATQQYSNPGSTQQTNSNERTSLLASNPRSNYS